MNILLFERSELAVPLPRHDPRAIHLLKVLRRTTGQSFDAGVINGPKGKGTLLEAGEKDLTLSFVWDNEPPPLEALTLIVGLTRPQTARDILRDATTLGVGAIHFVHVEKSEPSYAQSSLWSSGEWKRHLVTGAAQAFDTRIPEVTFHCPLAGILPALPPGGNRLALDNYEADILLSRCPLDSNTPVVFAIGPERGWSPRDRAALRAAAFHFVQLGPRVLRTEAAVVAAVALIRGGLGTF